MDKKKRIEQEVEKTMNAMDRLDRLEADPYFYTRLEARIKSREKEAAAMTPAWLGARLLKPALMTLLVLVNLVSAAFFLAGPKDSGALSAEKTDSPLYSYVSGVTEQYWDQDQGLDALVTDVPDQPGTGEKQ